MCLSYDFHVHAIVVIVCDCSVPLKQGEAVAAGEHLQHALSAIVDNDPDILVPLIALMTCD
jgi:hypothetical protein